jgi:large subunit ribosomal protein L25
MPEDVTLDISGLNLGKSVKIRDIEKKDFETLNADRITIATVDIPRALKSGEFDEEEGEEEEEGAEGAAGAEGAEGAEENKEGASEE